MTRVIPASPRDSIDTRKKDLRRLRYSRLCTRISCPDWRLMFFLYTVATRAGDEVFNREVWWALMKSDSRARRVRRSSYTEARCATLPSAVRHYDAHPEGQTSLYGMYEVALRLRYIHVGLAAFVRSILTVHRCGVPTNRTWDFLRSPLESDTGESLRLEWLFIYTEKIHVHCESPRFSVEVQEWISRMLRSRWKRFQIEWNVQSGGLIILRTRVSVLVVSQRLRVNFPLVCTCWRLCD